MHDYSIDRHPKEKIIFFLAYLAIASAPFLNDLGQQFVTFLEINTGWGLPPFIAIPILGLFFLIYQLFDKHLWKIRSFRKLLLVPDLNGQWVCSGNTTLKDGNQVSIDWNGEVTITQSWSKILVHLKTESSHSKSISACLFHEVGVGYKLLYEYESNPSANQHELKKHAGSAEILFAEDCKTGEGHYFTDQHRQTVGMLSLRRKK